MWVDGTTPSSRAYANYVPRTLPLGEGTFFQREDGEYEEDCWHLDDAASHAWGHAREYSSPQSLSLSLPHIPDSTHLP